MAPERKQRTKKGVISYTASAGHIGRNPGPSKQLKKVRERGTMSIIPVTRTLCPATSPTNDDLAPVYPEPYWKNFCHIADADTLVRLIEASEKTGDPYTVEALQLQHGPAVSCSNIDAADLIVLIIKSGTSNLEMRTRAQVFLFLEALKAPRLVRVVLHLAGKLDPQWEFTVYRLLGQAKDALTHLSLELSFCNRKALLAYLCSPAAAGLVSLELKSNTSLQTPLVSAFKKASLPNLRSLSLDLPPSKTNVTTLVAALRMRYNAGHKNALQIELKNEISDALRAEAAAIAVTFVEYCPMRF
ncbi:hypothetical protein K525DRAFT_251628 [Schizophyllum commune Loenen D]|nr:hypothetical protein K525DRAFT_251628 [Schizophyllum commune Loenen D]